MYHVLFRYLILSENLFSSVCHSFLPQYLPTSSSFKLTVFKKQFFFNHAEETFFVVFKQCWINLFSLLRYLICLVVFLYIYTFFLLSNLLVTQLLSQLYNCYQRTQSPLILSSQLQKDRIHLTHTYIKIVWPRRCTYTYKHIFPCI